VERPNIVARGLKCASCNRDSLTVSTYAITDFFKEGMLEIVYVCESCGWRSCDVYPMKEGKPAMLEFRIKNEKDLNVKVARSSTSIVRIPELGVEITPGGNPEGYITTVEGILDRIESAVKTKQESGIAVMRKLHEMREGTAPFTLIIEDPFGNSRIASGKTKRSLL
jgi:zinc finger protein